MSSEIQTAELSTEYLDQLRETLTDLVVEGATWEQDKFPHLRTKRPNLLDALVAACHRQCVQGVRTEAWIRSSFLAIRFCMKDHSEKDALKAIRRALAELPADEREWAYWAGKIFLQGLHQSKDVWHRVFEISHYGGIGLADSDAGWVRKRLSNPNEPLDHREMMLWAEMTSLNRTVPNIREFLASLKKLVSDAPSLVAIIDSRLKPRTGDAELRRLEAESAKLSRQSDRRAVKAHASWVKFWREVVRNPSAAFAPDRAGNTAWNLWQAMERSGQESRASGWN